MLTDKIKKYITLVFFQKSRFSREKNYMCKIHSRIRTEDGLSENESQDTLPSPN